VGRTALAFAPGDPQPCGEAIEIGGGRRVAPTIQPAPIHSFAELHLSCANFGDQRDRIGDGLQVAQLLFACLIDSGVR
jgi:hypothetical protein